MHIDVSELFKRTSLVLTILGVFLVLVAGLGGLPISGATLPVMSSVWRYVLGGSGGILLIIGVVLLLREYKQSSTEKELQTFDDILGVLKHRMSADKYFTTRTSETLLISQTKEEIWLVQETGSKVIEENLKTLSSLLQKGGKVRLIVTSADSSIVKLVAFRNKNLSVTDIAARQEEALRKVRALIISTKNSAGTFEIRYICYPLDITAVFVDPESAQPELRLGLVRMVGFQNFFDDKKDLIITFSKEPKTYQYFKRQFLEMWKLAEARKLE